MSGASLVAGVMATCKLDCFGLSPRIACPLLPPQSPSPFSLCIRRGQSAFVVRVLLYDVYVIPMDRRPDDDDDGLSFSVVVCYRRVVRAPG